MTSRTRGRGALAALVAALVAALTLLSSCGGGNSGSSESGDGDSLVLYTGRDKSLIQPLVDEFEAESGIDVDVRYGNSAEMAAQLLEEGEATPAEVFLSQEVGAAAAVANEGLLVSLPDDVIERVEERFRPHPEDGNRWIGVTARSRVIAYHPDLIEGPPPTGVLELTDPKYRDMVAWVPSNPSFQAFITAFRITRGDEAASKWLDDMIANGAEAYENNVAALEAVNAGDIPIALINHYYWARSRPELGDDLVAQIVFPKGDDPGGLVNATAVGITTTGEDSPEALEFVRYLLSDEGQDHFVEANFEYPVVPGIENPAGVPPLADLEGPAIDLSDLESLEETQEMLIDKGLIKLTAVALSRRRAPVPLIVGAVVALTVAVVPLVYLVIRASERGWDEFWDILWRSRTLELTVRSLGLAVVVTAACLVIGVALAWLVTRTDLPGRRMFQVALALPLALPSYVSAWSWLGFRPELHGFAGAALVLISVSYPYVYLPVMAALRRCDPALEETARGLGRTSASVMWRVTLPQVRLAAVGGALLVGLYALSDFGAVATMRYEALTQAIYRSYRSSFDRTPAAVLACVLAVLAVLVVVAESRVRRRAGVAKLSGALRPQPVVPLGASRWPMAMVPTAVLAVCLGVPIWGMVHWFTRGTSRADPAELWTAVRNTLEVGVLGVLAVVVVAFPVAVLAVRHAGRLSSAAISSAYAGHALPGVVVGLALVFVGIRLAPALYQRLPMLIFAYVVLFLSLALGSMQSAVAQIPVSLDGVARTLGLSVWGVWGRVTLRLAAPGIGAAATLVMLTIMKELPATLFLRPTGFETLSTELWSNVSSLSFAAAAPYAVAIVALAALPTALLAIAGNRGGRG